jgi:two-component system, cell cycle sensor histidine kinase and response regulator CckA
VLTPKTPPLSVLLVEDNPAHARLVSDLLEAVAGQPIALTHSGRLADALNRLRHDGFSAVLLDLSLPDSDGLETFTRVRAGAPNAPIVVLTGLADEETAARAVREGAQDYLVKGTVDGPLLWRSIRYAIERHAADLALRASEARYRHLIEGSLQGILIQGDGIVRLANQAAANIFGLDDSASLVGRSIWPFVTLDDQPRLMEFARRQRQGRPVPAHYEFKAIRQDGAPIWLDCLATTVPWEGADATLLTVVDISERKRAEEELRASEERLRQLVDNIKEALLVIELPSFHPLFLSRMWEQIWGIEIARAYRSPGVWLQSIHPDDRAAVDEGRSAIERGEPAVNVFRVVRPDDSIRWVRARTFPVFDQNGVVYRMVGLVEDITEIRQTGEQLRQAQKMEAVGRLAGGIAHDFNNLLTAILGYSDLILSDLRPDNPITADVQQIRNAGQSAASLTGQLLAFSRQQILEPQTIDVNDVMRRVDGLLRRVIGEDVELHMNLTANVAAVTADPGQLEQAIMNLAVNARDAMPGGGHLIIETEFVELDEQYAAAHPGASSGGHVMLAVSDSGVGMDDETKRRLFEPFFTTKPLGKGTGLGLATVYGIVKQSGGSIWVYSELGHGTTIKIYLPRVSGPIDAPPAATSPAVSSRGIETVLVLEDQHEPRAVVCDTLRRHGYAVLEAVSGKEALDIAARHDGIIHLLLTDVVMPDMSGRRVAQLLHDQRPDLRVIYMSGYTDDAIVRHGVLEPGLAFLQKPFSVDRLLRRVREVLDGSAPPVV